MEKDRKKEENENIQKLKSAKTEQMITIGRSYRIIGPNGEDYGKRFIWKDNYRIIGCPKKIFIP